MTIEESLDDLQKCEYCGSVLSAIAKIYFGVAYEKGELLHKSKLSYDVWWPLLYWHAFPGIVIPITTMSPFTRHIISSLTTIVNPHKTCPTIADSPGFLDVKLGHLARHLSSIVALASNNVTGQSPNPFSIAHFMTTHISNTMPGLSSNSVRSMRKKLVLRLGTEDFIKEHGLPSLLNYYLPNI